MNDTLHYQNKLASVICVGTKGICTYCGDLAMCYDHVIPWSYFHSGRRNLGKTGSGIIAPSCTDCNTILGVEIQNTLFLRADYVRKHLQKRFNKLNRGPVWSPEELMDLGENLRNHVKAISTARERIHKRLQWTETKTFKNILLSARQPRPAADAPIHIKMFAKFLGTTGY